MRGKKIGNVKLNLAAAPTKDQ